MYGYEKEQINLTISQVLQKVSQVKIFEWILNRKIIIGARDYRSPFRVDIVGNCTIDEIDGKLYFKDFGDVHKSHRDCFNLVMDYFSIGLKEAIEKIVERFDLPTNRLDYELDVYIPNEGRSRDRSRIFYQKRDWQKRDTKFWSKFFITKQQLEEDNVYPIRNYTIINSEGKKTVFSPFDISYVCIVDETLKIYRPENPNDKYRFITNSLPDNIGNLSNINLRGDVLVITKAYKDHRVIRNTLNKRDVVWVQNEVTIPSIEILTDLAFRFKTIIILFDNDEPGILGALSLQQAFWNIKPGIARIEVLPYNDKYKHKDPSDFAHREGSKELREVLNGLGIYGDDSTSNT